MHTDRVFVVENFTLNMRFILKYPRLSALNL